MRARSRTLLATTALLALGCAPEAVTIDMNFATSEGFMKSDQGRLRVFSLSDPELGLCPRLIDGLSTGNFPMEPEFDTDLTSVCALRGGVPLPDFGGGPHAFVVEMRSSANELILTGCTVAEIYGGAPDVRVTLYPTDRYAGVEPAEGTPASRCGGAS